MHGGASGTASLLLRGVRRAAGWLIVSALAAPLPSEASAQQAVRRDSAGIIIVENPSIGTLLAAVEFAPRFSLDIGGPAREPAAGELARTHHEVIPLRSGLIVVTNGHEVRFHRRDGSLVARAGTRGEGPGEFQSTVWGGCERGDGSFVALEVPTPRLTRLAQDGAILGTARFEGVAMPRTCGPGGFLVLPGAFESPGALRETAGREYLMVDFDGRALRRIGPFPSGHRGSLFPFEPLLGTGAGRIVAATGLAYEYTVHDATGRVRTIVRTADRPRRLGDPEFERIITDRARALSAPERRRAIEEVTARGVSRMLPAFTLLQVEASGRVWLKEPRLVRDRLEAWVVFDASGVLLGRVVPRPPLPPGAARPMVTGWTDREAIVQYEDADGFSHVALLPYTVRH